MHTVTQNGWGEGFGAACQVCSGSCQRSCSPAWGSHRLTALGGCASALQACAFAACQRRTPNRCCIELAEPSWTHPGDRDIIQPGLQGGRHCVGFTPPAKLQSSLHSWPACTFTLPRGKAIEAFACTSMNICQLR